MAEVKQITLTQAGLEKLEKELEYLRSTKRKEVSEKIKQALSFGDLSENSEYDEAKNEQAQVEMRIVELEKTLKLAKVIDESAVSTNVVSLGTIVKVLDMEFDEELEYSIVGSTEANPKDNKISDESPVGAGLLGAKVGDVVDVAVPSGTLQFKIISISK